MKLIENMDDLIENIKVANKYMDEGGVEKQKLIDKIAWGRCFVVVNHNGKKYFYPSKYIGYKNITADKYDLAIDGRDTNKAIHKVLGCRCKVDNVLYEEYLKFFNDIGIKPMINRKFWANEISL